MSLLPDSGPGGGHLAIGDVRVHVVCFHSLQGLRVTEIVTVALYDLRDHLGRKCFRVDFRSAETAQHPAQHIVVDNEAFQ